MALRWVNSTQYDLQGIGFDLGLTGFDAGELQSLLDDAPAAGLTDEELEDRDLPKNRSRAPGI